ncbi:MAG: response regulator transcription factor [Flavihumibacter sp.]
MLRILIADDHYAVRQALVSLLREHFITAEIGEAEDTDSLVKTALKHSWDLIITDLVMPGGGAMQAIKQIRPAKPALPVVVISTHSAEIYGNWTKKGGASVFLEKDKAGLQLVPAIKEILGR